MNPTDSTEPTNPTDSHPLSHPRNWSRNLPASGALFPGDPVGDRKFFDNAVDRPLALEGGGILTELTVAFETWGALSPTADNAILICHALTGDSHASGAKKPGHPEVGWWRDLIGPGRAIDTDRYFVVCSNVLGGCQGTTGPASTNPETGKPWGPEFPVVSIRDMVRVQKRLADHLGVEQWLSVVGGSMGAMQVLEWAAMYPERMRSIAPIASTLAASPWQIGWSAVGRTVVALDPRWRGGWYYDAALSEGPHIGLALARAVSMITYRSDALFEERFGRNLVDPAAVFGQWDRYQVESYLDYQGEKLVRRFDANSYLTLNRAMDLHDVGRGRGSMAKAVARIAVPALVLSIESDSLYHPRLQREMHATFLDAGVESEFHSIASREGHDGFLLEDELVGAHLHDYLLRVEKGWFSA